MFEFDGPLATVSTVPGLESPSFALLSWKELYTSERPEKRGFLLRKPMGESVLDAIVPAVSHFAAVAK